MKTIRFGLLSTASVNEYGILPHVKNVQGMELVAVASRSIGAASKYAIKHGIPMAYGSYDELLADRDIDCVYIPLPVSMHKEWTLKSFDAGKHVLCEKPAAANAKQAMEMADGVAKTGLVFAEAFHYRYHPLSAKLEEIVRGGEIGDVIEVRSSFGVPLADRGKVQFNKETAGGALLDIGCYPLSFSRWIAGCDTATVVRTKPTMTPSGVDGTMRAELLYDNGVRARIAGSLIEYMPMHATIRGSKGSVFIFMPFTPAVPAGPIPLDMYLFLLFKGASARSIRVKHDVTYRAQLESFCNCVRTSETPITGAAEAVANMKLIDAIHEKSGIDMSAFD